MATKSNQGKLLPNKDATSTRVRTVDPAVPFLVQIPLQTQSLHTRLIPLGHSALEGKGLGWISPFSSTVVASEQDGEERGLAFVTIGPLSAMGPWKIQTKLRGMSCDLILFDT